jgi:hypothetical protein
VGLRVQGSGFQAGGEGPRDKSQRFNVLKAPG